jgi:hypothetical protein
MVNNYKILSDNDGMVISIKANYRIKNLTDGNLWLYDLEHGSIWQSSITRKKNKAIEKKYSMYEIFEGFIPYSIIYPRSKHIPPRREIDGDIEIKFRLENGCDDKKNITKFIFNFFILTKDIKGIENEDLLIDIIKTSSKEYFVEFLIRESKIPSTMASRFCAGSDTPPPCSKFFLEN